MTTRASDEGTGALRRRSAKLDADIHDAYGFPQASDAQRDRIDQQLRSLELDRSQRIKAQHGHAAPQPPTHRAAGGGAAAGVPIRTRRTKGPSGSEADGRGGRFHVQLVPELIVWLVSAQDHPFGGA